ncbi:chemotaxis response regulator protein-glutamate methylesterase [Anaerobacillus arseniciselenatis]|uniref:Protein-glutamate methylesterase/protein-glutamine glutaminase n=1 Tax=Anaerobacillus arseniciselenatis TaxID=85682 RepID=A0A1S2LCA0_9BACI|nr:chemotaxis response regulator protein-glutamate methylesterase [Anaerobacillus arseniciselenatis]OIJ10021.1 chemotaxis response regulator protein-glutamate methylesterase [Anaerobacillus arseniciselenatis]
MRKMITDLLEEDQRIEVIATARNGQDAIKKIQDLNPDVVTLDVEMPVMNGIDALKKIMKTVPKPVIMVSSTTKEGAENTVLAMSFGAIDFIAKPSGAISLDLHKVQQELIDKVLLAANVKLTKVLQKKQANEVSKSRPTEVTKSQPKKLLDKKVIAIGTSTGGPKALQQVLTKLPEDINVPIFIVQHMPVGFTKSLASRLNNLSKIMVKEAEDGEVVKKGVAYIAPGGYHLKIRSIGTTLAIQLDQTPPENGHRPSVDTMLNSLANINQYSIITVIMTGMGSDGTKGLLKLKNNQDVIAIAESEESAVVFGMPRAAINTNKVDEIVHLNDIAKAIVSYC